VPLILTKVVVESLLRQSQIHCLDFISLNY